MKVEMVDQYISIGIIDVEPLIRMNLDLLNENNSLDFCMWLFDKARKIKKEIGATFNGKLTKLNKIM